jgi:prepilin-type N-terminal cleavage/methylation domain-containing protein
MVRGAFTLIEVLTGIMIMSIVMVVSMQSVGYINHIHQQNEIRYLALNRIDSEMSRLVMAYENYYDTSSNFMSTGTSKFYLSTSKKGIEDNSYGLKITSGKNFIQIKDIVGNENEIEDGDFIGILNWETNNTSNDTNLSLTITYPYIYHNDTDFPQLWNFVETINLKTSTRIP